MCLLVLFIIILINGYHCEEVFGCGGFVKSDFVINYSRVEIKLYTKQGSLKYLTDCAPNNGYYLIPLYDKGDYILKIEPPSGWSFEPNTVSLHVDGNTDPCSLNQDINFAFRGFMVSGKVLSYGNNNGPQEIQLALKNSNGEIIQDTKSITGGYYSFSDVLPGNYIIKASHSKWTFDESLEHIKVAQDNVRTEEKIVIAGFDVSGHVFSEGEPIQGVNFLLFSRSKHISNIPSGCKKEFIKIFTQQRKIPYLCYVTSLTDGSFNFPSLPPGNYTLVPFYKGEHIEFDVSPAEVNFEVMQDSFTFSEDFTVEGFSVTGRVLEAPNGKGLEGADIFINDKKYTTTEKNGLYHLENMRAGLYQIEVKMQHIFFEIVTMKVTPNTPHLPEIFASKFSICGLLQIDQYPSELQVVDREVILKSPDSDFYTNIPVSPDGNFCSEASPGTYNIEPVVSEDEISYGLKFVPSSHVINVLHYPILNIKFIQFQAVIQGKVKCLTKCSDLLLDIVSLSSKGLTMKTTTDRDGKFRVAGYLPGSYRLSVEKDDWCFQSKSIEFTVTETDVSNLELLQTGFRVPVVLSHPSPFNVKYPSGEVHSVQLQNTENVLCLPESGIYDFTPVGCHIYEMEVFKYDTNDPVEINLKPIKHLVAGIILTEMNVTDIKVFIKYDNDNLETIHLDEPLEKKDSMFRYKFSVFVEPNTELEVKVASDQFLFHPHISHVSVLDDCIENALEIVGKKGLFINGSVTPPLESVRMQVLNKKMDLKLAEVLTDKFGKFLVGPLDDDVDYIVKADKEGYIFTQQDTLGNFLAYKLAEIVVQVKTETGSPLSGVLLSLSGGIDYRKNSITQRDGKMSFVGLSPGQYFLRPMLKEFQFQPSTKMIDIKEGTQVNVKISGKRVAYSLFGVVNSLTGESEMGVAIEAVGVDNEVCQQYQEEAISEQGGFFRIRGLQPDCRYSMHLKKGADVNQHIERATPEEIIFKVTDEDINDVRFIVFRHFGQMDVSGSIVAHQNHLQTLKVRLYSEENPDQIIHTVALGRSSFFYLPSIPIDNRIYNLRLDSSLSSSSYFFDLPSVTFCANTSFYHFTFSFIPQAKSVDQEVTQGSILALPFTILIFLLVYNYTKFLEFAMQFCYSIYSVLNPVRMPLSVESIATENINTRRKLKPRRTQ